MYRYEVEIVENGETYVEYIWADNRQEAREIAEIKYPNADIYV